MKNIFNLTVLIILLAFIGKSTFAQDVSKEHKSIIEAVKQSMQSMVGSIPENLLPNYGIKNSKEIEKAVIGTPIGMYTITNNEMIFTHTWRVPLLVENQSIALFTVIENKETGRYSTVDFGATTLAHELDNNNEKEELFGMLRVYEIKKDFKIHSNSKGSYQFAPIPNETKHLYSLKEILNLIQQ